MNLVWEDNGYGMITWKMDNEFGQPFGTDFPAPDIAKLAEALGCYAQRIRSADEFRPVACHEHGTG